MPMKTFPSLAASLGALTLALLAPLAAQADGPRQALRSPAPASFEQECGACHVAFPPAMLPAASWQRLSANLGKHFGVDASLDAATAKELSTWLIDNAGTHRRVVEAPPEDRISRAAWFVRKHDEVSARTWKLPAVKSAANCSACHPKAQEGDFDEHAVRIPR
ncbi:MAG: diheme cytochrome c [Burkholderiales bacterium]|nr:diheme cytochrome c [Burkholderiales bacterium]